MKDYSFYLLWLPKYFDEYYNSEIIEEDTFFLKKLKFFLFNHNKISTYSISIYDKKIPKNIKKFPPDIMLYYENESIGYWGNIEFKFYNSNRIGKVIFNEFGFYYFEFKNFDESFTSEIDKEFIQTFFSKEHDYPLLSETQQDVLKETFLNDHLDHESFNRRDSDKKVRLEKFIIEACYEANDQFDFNNINTLNKILKLKEHDYEVKKDEYYTFESLSQNSTRSKFQQFLNGFKERETETELYEKTRKKLILDYYEEQAISKFLHTVVSVNYFDRITKSIKEVREGLTGKIIFMTPQETRAIDSKYESNEVFQKWSEEKIENYVQLLISKKPLFIKLDNALKSAYYISIGNLSSLGHVNDKEDITQLYYYNEWKSLLGYFLETTNSLNDILHLYHSNRTYSELEEIKHYESNNHDKEDIDSLIQSNANKLGISEDSKFFVMVFAIIATMLMAVPDAISSIGTFKDFFYANETVGGWFNYILSDNNEWSKAIGFGIVFYGTFILLILGLLGSKIWKFMNYAKNTFKNRFFSWFKKSIKTAPDDFDILEHRSNLPIKTFYSHNNYFKKFTKIVPDNFDILNYSNTSPINMLDFNKSYFKRILVTYQEHMSIHRFVPHIEKLTIVPIGLEESNDFKTISYSILPEIVTLENLQKKYKRFYEHLKTHSTTKFSVNRVDKAKMKVTMRYRINRIKINDFFNYYENLDSYVQFYDEHCSQEDNGDLLCQKIYTSEVIKQLKKDFRFIDAEFSFVAIYSFSLISKTLDHKHQKKFFLHKDSFRVYFHIDKYPLDYYNKEFSLKNKAKETINLRPYDAISEMVYLVFLGRLKGFNRYMVKEKDSL